MLTFSAWYKYAQTLFNLQGRHYSHFTTFSNQTCSATSHSEVQIWLSLPLLLTKHEPIKCDNSIPWTNHEPNQKLLLWESNLNLTENYKNDLRLALTVNLRLFNSCLWSCFSLAGFSGLESFWSSFSGFSATLLSILPLSLRGWKIQYIWLHAQWPNDAFNALVASHGDNILILIRGYTT